MFAHGFDLVRFSLPGESGRLPEATFRVTVQSRFTALNSIVFGVDDDDDVHAIQLWLPVFVVVAIAMVALTSVVILGEKLL